MSTTNETGSLQVTVLLVSSGTVNSISRTTEIVLLALLFIISFGMNSLLLVTLISSSTLRRIPFSFLLAHFAFVFVCESLLNITTALHFVTANDWKLGPSGCSISAFSVHLVTIELTFGLCGMCVEGTAAISQPLRFQTFLTLTKQAVVVCLLWLAGIVVSSPLLLKSMIFYVFPSRYTCAASGNFIYALCFTIGCYAVPLFVGLVFLVHLVIKQYNEYKMRKKKNGIMSAVFVQGDLWTEWVNLKVIVWLFIFYLFLELPYVITQQTTALSHNSYDDQRNQSINVDLIYAPKDRYETLFTYLRYLNACVFASFIFYMRKDIRHKFCNLFDYCRKNSNRDHSPLTATRVTKIKDEKPNKKISHLPLSLSTPILYISPEGLCLRQLDPNNKYLKFERFSNPTFISYLCDVSFSNNGNESFATGSVMSNNSEMASISEKSDLSPSDALSSNHPLEEIISPSLKEPEPDKSIQPRKNVRFAETLTIYRTLTPNSVLKTPDWVLSGNQMPSGISKRRSRIPTRIQRTENFVPWKLGRS